MRSANKRSVRQPSAPIQTSRPLLILLTVVTLAGCVGVATQLTPRHRWNEKWGPMVPHHTFPGDCSTCHISADWQELREDFTFDHAEETGYALTGAHDGAACLRCHNDRGPVQGYVERGCGGCHVDPHKSTLGIDCERCHNEVHWEPIGAIADHANTRFPLIASHALTTCESCHQRATVGDYRGAPVECHLCHQTEASQASPNHVINGWVTGCEDCHTPAAWAGAQINHDFFPLVGGHAGLACGQCHPNEQFVAIPNDCFSCHQNDYTAAPNHVALNFPTTCELCHNINAWTP
ncbi:MAG: cytochrome c3 family protein [Planctomycetota bacterium]